MPELVSFNEKINDLDYVTTTKVGFNGRDVSPSEIKIEHQPTKTNETEVIERVANKPSEKNINIKSIAGSVLKKGIECIGGAAIGLAGTIIGNLVAGPIGGLIGGVVGSAAGEIIGNAVGKKITE